MAQFDIHANTGQNRADIPYVIQSRRFEEARTRLVAASVRNLVALWRANTHASVPRCRQSGDSRSAANRGNPAIIAGPNVASLADDASSSATINAIDAVITRAYG